MPTKLKPAPPKVPQVKVMSSGIETIEPASTQLLAELLPQLSRRKGKVGQLARRFQRLRGIGTEKALLQLVRKPDIYKFAKNLLRIVIVSKAKGGPNGKLTIVATDKQLLRDIAA
jgi:hypothetical protein